MDKRNRLFPCLAASTLVAILILSSCSMPTATVIPGSPVAPTSPSGPTSLGPTSPSSTAISPTGTSTTPLPAETITITAAPTFTLTTGTPAADCGRAEFVSDVTYPDGATVNAKESITKTWRVKNAGSCAWDSKYKLVFIRGEQMSGPSPADIITGVVAPGATVDISVAMKAPDINGTHFGVWQLYNASGIPVPTSKANPFELSIQIVISNGTGGQVSSIHGWVYTYVGAKCSNDVQYDVSTSIYASGAVNVSYTWSASNGLLTVVTQNTILTSSGSVQVSTHLSPPYANPNNIRLTLTANGSVQSSFTICP